MKLINFYNSKEWHNFRRALMLERVNSDGDLICHHCGKAVVNKYDCILHHVEELTEQNVNDNSVALNPDNIVILHHKCHNEMHKRFGHFEKKVYIVHGSPRSGKSTYVESTATSDDLIIDIDRIFSALNMGRNERIFGTVMDVYRYLIDGVKVRRGKWINCYIVRTFPLRGERERLAAELGAELIHIDTPKDICLSRCTEEWQKKIVTEYFEKFVPPEGD